MAELAYREVYAMNRSEARKQLVRTYLVHTACCRTSYLRCLNATAYDSFCWAPPHCW